jgi:hypothetical protein
MLLALFGLVYGSANNFVFQTNDAKDTTSFIIDVPVVLYLDANDAQDVTRFTIIVPHSPPNDAVDTSFFHLIVSYSNVLDQLPLLRARYGCAYNEDFNLVLDFLQEDVQGLTFVLSIGFGADVAMIDGIIRPTYHNVTFYVPAASGPLAWANQGMGGSGPGNYVMQLLATEGSYTRQLFQYSSFILGEAIPPQINPVGPVPVPRWTPHR